MSEAEATVGHPPRRAYDSSRRKAAAARRRERILDAAAACFATAGWSRTTIAEIAREAQVSPELVIRAFGTKAGLLFAAYRRVGFGHHADLQEAFAALRLDTVSDASLRLDMVVEFAVQSLVPLAPLLPALQHAASADSAARGLVERARVRRREMCREMVQQLGGNAARSTVVDEVYVLTSGQTYLQFVGELGWSPERYAEWLRAALSRSLAS